jgi:hypothetical protein
VLSALSVAVAPDWQGKGISREAVKAMRQLAVDRGLKALIAPVRPSLKPQYPLMPPDEYAHLTRPDGLPFDPWMRVHARLGARLIRVCPHAMLIEGTLEQWKTWTGVPFPVSGEYVVPGALMPVQVDCAAGRARYVEPNVWMVHPLDAC